MHFQQMQERIIRFVTQHSRITVECFTRYCYNNEEMATDIGTILDGEEAVKSGLIDELGSLSDALSTLHRMIGEGK
jgi:ATP-dependent protease ClpP protease subunit